MTEFTGELTTDMSYAIYGSKTEFGPEAGPAQLTPTAIKPKFEARAIYELLRGVGTTVFPVATDVDRVAGDRVYRKLSELPQQVEVLIVSLTGQQALAAIEECAGAGIPRIWFQPATDSQEALRLCSTRGIRAIKGCALRHRTVSGLTRFISPCFYMGLHAAKLPVRRQS